MEVEDAEVVQDKVDTTKQSDWLEAESTSPSQMALESVHDRNTVKNPSPHDVMDNDKILVTPIVPLDSVSVSC